MADYNLSYPENGGYNPVQPAGTYSDVGSGGGGFDFNGLTSTIGNNLGNWFNGIANLVNAANGNSGYNPYQQAANPYAQLPGAQPQQPQGISSTTVIVLVVLFILLLTVGYLVIKKS